MPWCPKCKCEYREKFTKCSDCGSELVKVLEVEENLEEREIQGDKVTTENDVEALLISVSNDIEARIIESKLNAFGVPTAKQFRGINGIYGFAAFSGIDIYVPSSLLNNAKDILGS
jgi:hypothetical protein